MITRLQIDGFKNLVKTDIRFGPFTCIAGSNAVGKSNLFDAIRFLSDLTSKTLVDAAVAVRSEGQRDSDIRDLFHRVGDTYTDQMSFSVDMIIPKEGIDDLGQVAQATITTVRYKLTLALRRGNDALHQGLLEIVREELAPIPQREAYRDINFYPSFAHLTQKEQDDIKRKIKAWKNSIILGKRSAKFISTEGEGPTREIRVHSDGNSGQAIGRLASQLPRTILSVANALANPTALIVKNEMQSWKLLQLEPGALRRSDGIHIATNAKLATDGSHLPVTLYRLHIENQKKGIIPNTYQFLANRLSELVDGIKTITVDRDEKRGLLTLILQDRQGISLPARALSDGTLRFLALAILELDTSANEVICLEEPENGIHAGSIDAMVRLLQDIATDIMWPVAEDNPLRQVIINTHSPTVIGDTPEDSLLIAELREDIDARGNFFKKVVFIPLADTWRMEIQPEVTPISFGKLLTHLNPTGSQREHKRVIDREEVRKQLGLFEYET